MTTTLTARTRRPLLSLMRIALFALLATPVLGAAEAATPGPPSTPTAGITEETWFETTIPADALPPSGPVFLGLFRIVWEEGAGYRYQENAPGVAIDCVVSGQLAFRPDVDELLIRADARQEPVAAPGGEETTLEPGDCMLLHTDVHRDEHNVGAGPVDFVGVVIIPEQTPPPAGAPEAIEFGPMGYIYGGHWSRTANAPSGPIHLALRRVTLAPGASVPEQTVVGDALIAVTDGALGLTAAGGEPLVERGVSFTSDMPTAVPEGSETPLEAGDSAHVSDGTVFMLRNPGNAAVSWWFVTVVPVAGAGTPVA
jgi:mannose-6-phosphate isomerase-like protein (cupin superfamily)